MLHPSSEGLLSFNTRQTGSRPNQAEKPENDKITTQEAATWLHSTKLR